MQFCHRFCVLSWCVVCLSRGGTYPKKLFLDFSLDGAAVNPYMGCCWSKLHFCRSDWLDTSRQMLGGGGINLKRDFEFHSLSQVRKNP